MITSILTVLTRVVAHEDRQVSKTKLALSKLTVIELAAINQNLATLQILLKAEAESRLTAITNKLTS